MNVCLMSTQSIHILKSVCIITTSFYLQNKVCVCDVMPFFLFLCVRFYVCAFLCVCVCYPAPMVHLLAALSALECG